MNLEEEIIKKIPADKVYDDAISPAMRQIGGALESTAKAARFILAPIEYVAAYRDRWEKHLQKVSSKVAEENLMQGHPQIVVPVMEGLILSYDESLLSEMFINLLACSIDKTKQNFVHPAFPRILQSLSHDEAVILFHLKRQDFKLRQQSDFNEMTHLFSSRRVVLNEFPLNDLQFPDQFFTLMDHLHSLTLAGVWQDGNQEVISDKLTEKQTGVYINSNIQLTDFGKLFVAACVPDQIPSDIKSE